MEAYKEAMEEGRGDVKEVIIERHLHIRLLAFVLDYPHRFGTADALIENGAKPNIKNEFGYDAYHYATEEHHDKKRSKEIMSLLKSYKYYR